MKTGAVVVILIGLTMLFIATAVEGTAACIDSDGDGVCDEADACNNGAAPPGLISYWGFEEGSGATAEDSFNSNPGGTHELVSNVVEIPSSL